MSPTISKKLCAFLSCNGREKKDQTFHRFPRDFVRCRLWVRQCKNPSLTEQFSEKGPLYVSGKWRVCSDHFSKDELIGPYRRCRRRITRESVPKPLKEKNSKCASDPFPYEKLVRLYGEESSDDQEDELWFEDTPLITYTIPSGRIDRTLSPVNQNADLLNVNEIQKGPPPVNQHADLLNISDNQQSSDDKERFENANTLELENMKKRLEVANDFIRRLQETNTRLMQENVQLKAALNGHMKIISEDSTAKALLQL